MSRHSKDRDIGTKVDGDLDGTASTLVSGTGAGSARELWLLSYPIVVSMVSQALMGVVDTFFLGWTEQAPRVSICPFSGNGFVGVEAIVERLPIVGTAQQGGAGIGAVLSWTLMSFMIGTLTAVTPFVAQNNGSGHRRVCGSFVWQALYLVVPFALLAFLMGWHVHDFLILVGPTESIRPYAILYTKIRLFGAAPLFVSFALVSFLRGIGDTKTPMWVSVLANVTNVVLNYLLIFGKAGFPAMGVAGAALATVLSSGFGALLYLTVSLSSRLRRTYGTLGGWRFAPARMKRLLAVGAPIGGNWILENGSWAFFAVLVSRLGPRQMAAHTVVLQLMHLSFLPSVAMLIGTTTLVAHYLGKKQVEVAQETARTSFKVVLGYALVVGLVFLVARHRLIGLFNRDPVVIAVGSRLLLFTALFVLLDGVYLIAVGTLRGAGDTTWPFWFTAISAWCIFAPLAYVLANVVGWGIYGAWTALLFHGGFLATALFLQYRKGEWKHADSLVEPVALPDMDLGTRPVE